MVPKKELCPIEDDLRRYMSAANKRAKGKAQREGKTHDDACAAGVDAAAAARADYFARHPLREST